MMNELNPTPINPKGFTNTDNITGIFGTQMPGAFARDVNNTPDMQAPAPVDYTSAPVPPPVGVETSITPNYNINNQ